MCPPSYTLGQCRPLGCHQQWGYSPGPQLQGSAAILFLPPRAPHPVAISVSPSLSLNTANELWERGGRVGWYGAQFCPMSEPTGMLDPKCSWMREAWRVEDQLFRIIPLLCDKVPLPKSLEQAADMVFRVPVFAHLNTCFLSDSIINSPNRI